MRRLFWIISIIITIESKGKHTHPCKKQAEEDLTDRQKGHCNPGLRDGIGVTTIQRTLVGT